MTRAASTETRDRKSAPSADDVGRELDADPELLARFEVNHPNPTVKAILGMADARDAGEDTRQLVERWLQTRAEIDRGVSLPWGGDE